MSDRLTTRVGTGVSRRQAVALVAALAATLGIFFGPARTLDTNHRAADKTRDALQTQVGQLQGRLTALGTGQVDINATLAARWQDAAELLPNQIVPANVATSLLELAGRTGATVSVGTTGTKPVTVGELAYYEASITVSGEMAQIDAFLAGLAEFRPLTTVTDASYANLTTEPSVKLNLRLWYTTNPFVAAGSAPVPAPITPAAPAATTPVPATTLP